MTFSTSLRRQVAAIIKLTSRGMFFWDYGNAFLLEASRAGESRVILLYAGVAQRGHVKRARLHGSERKNNEIFGNRFVFS
jgi:urocanate hydratase